MRRAWIPGPSGRMWRLIWGGDTRKVEEYQGLGQAGCHSSEEGKQ